MPSIELDDEELHAVIDFQLAAASDADDSCEYEEAKTRRARAAHLKTLLNK